MKTKYIHPHFTRNLEDFKIQQYSFNVSINLP